MAKRGREPKRWSMRCPECGHMWGAAFASGHPLRLARCPQCRLRSERRRCVDAETTEAIEAVAEWWAC